MSQNGYGETVITLIVCRFSVSIAYTSIDHGIDGLECRSMGDGPPMGGFSRGRPNPEGRTGGPTAHRRQWCNPGTRLRLRTPRAARKPPGKVPDAGGPQGSNRPLGIPGIKGGSGGAGGPHPRRGKSSNAESPSSQHPLKCKLVLRIKEGGRYAETRGIGTASAEWFVLPRPTESARMVCNRIDSGTRVLRGHLPSKLKAGPLQ